MPRLRHRFLLLALLLTLIGLLLLAVRLAPEVAANGERVAALRTLAGAVGAGSIEELAWDAGWHSLCSPERQPATPESSLEAAGFIARSQLDRGDYAGALAGFRRIATSDDDAEAALSSAYVAALEMRWLDAARFYPGQSTARHQRFWGTIFYLAAQELMFRGQTGAAAEWYRRADQSYGVQGPYLGLSLVDCLAQQGRTLETFDAYRRALVVLPPGEALAQRERFEQLRLEALRLWREQDPANAQVTAWLAFYEGDRPAEEQETLASAPQPQVKLIHYLGDGRQLIGFDYRPQDIATGPFMWVDLYVQEGRAADDPIVHLRRAVLNQAPNGSFAWDAAPDGVRPFGWHGNLYSTNLSGIEFEEIPGKGRRLCMNGRRLQAAIGLESLAVPVVLSSAGYLQGGAGIYVGDRPLAFGRTWFKDVTGTYPYSYVEAAFPAGETFAMLGAWMPQPEMHHVALWLFSHATSRACAQGTFLIAVPER